MPESDFKYEIVDVPVEKMKPGPNVRKDPHESELRPLGESLLVRQFHPVILDPDYFIVDGWRRWLAAQLVALKTLKAIVAAGPITPSQLRIAQVVMSTHRAGLTPGELYTACYELLQVNQTWSAKDLAQHLKMSPSHMTRVLSASRCEEPIRNAFLAGEIDLTQTYAISKEPLEKQAAMLEMALNGAGRDELELHRRKPKRRRNGSSAALTNVTIPLPSGTTVIFRGAKVGIDEVIQAAGDVQREAKRGRDQLHLDAKSFEVVMRQKSKGDNRPEVANA